MAELETELFCSCCLCVNAPGRAIGKGKLRWESIPTACPGVERVGNLHQGIQPNPPQLGERTALG